jgi:CheY-like chemotaxis protein
LFTVLIVDNDKDIVESLRIVLESSGYRVLSAYSGEEGYARVLASRPDLVILDVMMETIDKGYEICDRMKGNPGTRSIPVIMLTAIKEMADLDDARRKAVEETVDPDDADRTRAAVRAGPEMICEKPIRPEDLVSRVRLLLGG